MGKLSAPIFGLGGLASKLSQKKAEFNKKKAELVKKKAELVDTLLPGWTNSRIDSMLFVPDTKEAKSSRVPKEIKQSELRTSDGVIQIYRAGKGPMVVFVHGWGGGAFHFFSMMRGLAQCGYSSLAFDQLGHGLSERKPATLHQSVLTTNEVLKQARRSSEGLGAIVGHSTGCIAIASARNPLVRNIQLFMISPVFNYKLYFLKRLVRLKLHSDQIKQYATRFAKTYRSNYESLELAQNLEKYSDATVIAHEESDSESAFSESVKFCTEHPLTKLLATKNCDHVRIISSESVWQELKTHLNLDEDTNYSAELIHR